MSIAMALLSGKGGSGKTTLALSMADLFCRCNIKALLIDCDIITNGATYFYESALVDKNNSMENVILSFFDVLVMKDDSAINISPLLINQYYDFLPSVSNLSVGQIVDGDKLRNSSYNINKLLMWARTKYDVILFDCHAGYTDLLPNLLPLMDVDLFVLEPDSITASAMRNLHLKTGHSFGNAKLFQVFNKVTEEEFDYYSKIQGTFFTNIGTLLFDMTIKQAFSRSQAPDLESTSSNFGSDLCDICKIAFNNTKIKKELELFSVIIADKKITEERNLIMDKLDKLNNSPGFTRKRFILVIMLWLGVILSTISFVSIFSFMSNTNSYINTVEMILLFMSIGVLLVSYGFSVSSFSDLLNRDKKIRSSYERRLNELNKKLQHD